MKSFIFLINEFSKLNFYLSIIEECGIIFLGPTGKIGICLTSKNEIKFLTNGAIFLKNLQFSLPILNTLLKIFEQASLKTTKISGDGSTSTFLLSSSLLKDSLIYCNSGYNPLLISNGLKKIAYFCNEYILKIAIPISKKNLLEGVFFTAMGKKISIELKNLLRKSLSSINREGLITIEENKSDQTEIDIVQGVELDKGFASSYFVNNFENFEVFYEEAYLLITSYSIHSIHQLNEIIHYVKKENRPLIIIVEDISKDVLSSLILNNIQKKLKIAVIHYKSIKFLKTGILEDLAILTHTNYFSFSQNLKLEIKYFFPKDLGQVQKVILKKDKSTFFVSNFSKIISKRRINELNRELLFSETDYEKNILKTRIARLSGSITKIKLGFSNIYQSEEERNKIENLFSMIESSLEEGGVPGGGSLYITLKEEIKNWGYLNLIGDEIIALQIISKSFLKLIQSLCKNFNFSMWKVIQAIEKKSYPFVYDLEKKQLVNSFQSGLLDSAKSARAILWNSLIIVSTILTSI